ncbi:MAG: 1-acyl-sn-glycerol-3-phosphate acyltransferase, partial [Alphaproteobacteria bacterium]|nr:1-acyl-sn-glycerol-3-phosphate acyltransferase [Alphaproteobacteria bacterium]
MIVVRSLLFNVLYLVWTVVAGTLLLLPMFLLPRKIVRWGPGLWAWGILGLAAVIIPLRFEVRGREFLPKGPAIIASKHQSAWETFVFHALLVNTCYVLKRELFYIPIVGWLMWKDGSIGIDRSKGTSALKIMIRGATKALANHRQVVVFPEGTRTAPGTDTPYQPGISMLYQNFDVPLIPVALNSGLFWSRRRFFKQPGTIVIEFMSPMPRGFSKR